MTVAEATCAACGIALPPNSKFCNECGAAVSASPKPAEYKQVTLLFADVVRSMDIAAAVGPERLRDIMAELLDRSAAVVKRYGGTLSQFTGDGIMAVFGAPVTLEDHAFRACLAALDIQAEANRLATEIEQREHVTLNCASASTQARSSRAKSAQHHRVTRLLVNKSAWLKGWSRWLRRAA